MTEAGDESGGDGADAEADAAKRLRPSSPSTMSSSEFVKRKRDRANPEALGAARTADTTRIANERTGRFSLPLVAPQARSSQRKNPHPKKPMLEKRMTPASAPATKETKSDSRETAAPHRNSTSAACRRSNRSAPEPTSRRSCRPGVPAAMTHAALRRAWSADPAIRDFIGPHENYWDAAGPDGIPGFGDLDPNLDVRRMVSELFGETPTRRHST